MKTTAKTVLKMTITNGLLASLVTIMLLFYSCAKDQSSGTKNEQVYDQAEVMPEFPGGSKAMYDYIVKNIQYPAKAKENRISGTVYIQFIVDGNGNVKSSKILKGTNELLDSEALRVVNQMPKWTPGSNQGKPVSVYLNLPVKFQYSTK